MTTKRLTRRNIPEMWRDTTHWPAFDPSSLSEEAKSRFDRFRPGIALYLREGRLRHAASATQCSPEVFIRQLNRCLHVKPDGSILGWAGLIRHSRIGEYTRHTKPPVGSGAAAQGGAGAFQQLLKAHPQLRKELDVSIRKGLGTKDVRATKNTSKSIWALFLRICNKLVGPDDYPFNSKSRGRRSIDRYVKAKLDTDPKTVGAWFGKGAAKAAAVGNGESSFDFVYAPYDMAGFDAHKMDCIGTVIIDGPAGPQPVAIQRIWIYALIDFFSKAALGYAVSITIEPTSSQLEEALAMSQRLWQRRELVMSGMSYKEGAGFPCGSVEGLTGCLPCAVRGDNGMPGFARVITVEARSKLGNAVSFGESGAWWQNAITEWLFRQLEQRGFQRLPSATGKNANDPLRNDPVGKAIKHQVTWAELVDLIDIFFADYNAEPSSGIGHQAPLDVLRNWSDPVQPMAQWGLQLPPTVSTPRIGITVERRTVRGHRRPGKYRSAYIQIDKCTYSSKELAPRLDLVGVDLTVHIDKNDMRSVVAFLPNGQPLGELHVRERGWRRTKHTRDMRKTINRLRDGCEMPDECEDFVASYMEHLARKTAIDAKQRPKKISQAATQLAEGSRTTGMEVPTVDGVPRISLVHLAPLPTRPIPVLIKRPSWR